MTNNQEINDLIGKELGVSEWIQITQEMVNTFADVTQDPQWIHVDVEKAKKFMPETGTIVHGYFTMSLLTPMMKQATNLPNSFRVRIKSIINYGINKLRFTSAVPVGSKIRAKVLLADAEDTPKGTQLTYGVTVEIDGAPKPALVAETLVFYILK